jgi:hypothetical protein
MKTFNALETLKIYKQINLGSVLLCTTTDNRSSILIVCLNGSI